MFVAATEATSAPSPASTTSSFTPANRETNAELFAGLPGTRDQIVQQNEPLVWMVAKRLQRPPGVDIEDLVQEGMAILCKCVDYFDSTRGTEFSTYACTAIRCRLVKYLNSNWSLIRAPHQREPSRTRYAEDRERARCIASIDSPDDGQCPLADTTTYEMNVEHIDAHVDSEQILATARTLGLITSREQYILCQRAKGKTLVWLGWKLDVCRERVRQIERRALRSLREMMAEV